jgi:hypothetical protein
MVLRSLKVRRGFKAGGGLWEGYGSRFPPLFIRLGRHHPVGPPARLMVIAILYSPWSYRRRKQKAAAPQAALTAN